MTKQKWVFSLFVFIVAFISGFMLAPPTYAADLGYRWLTNTATIKSYATIYNTYVLNTRNDYHNNTDMNIYIAASDPDISLVQGNYATPWKAAGIGVSNNGPCGDFSTGNLTGNCNTTNSKAYAATIYINYGQGAFSPNERDWVVRHELGHIFGMGHESLCSSTVMDNSCNTSNLKPFDINLINSWY